MADSVTPATAVVPVPSGAAAQAAPEQTPRKRPFENVGGGMPEGASMEKMFEMMMAQQKRIADAIAAASAAAQGATAMMMCV